jgi:hypothetical protein
MRRIGVIGVPPPEERRWKIDQNSRDQLEPWMSKLRLVTELPSHPLRGRPHRGERDHKGDGDLPPENFRRGHDDQGSNVARLKSKCRNSPSVRTACAGYNSDRCTRRAVEGLLSQGNPKNMRSMRVFRILTPADSKRGPKSSAAGRRSTDACSSLRE